MVDLIEGGDEVVVRMPTDDQKLHTPDQIYERRQCWAECVVCDHCETAKSVEEERPGWRRRGLARQPRCNTQIVCRILAGVPRPQCIANHHARHARTAHTGRKRRARVPACISQPRPEVQGSVRIVMQPDCNPYARHNKA